jgi:hypothetical protein
VKGRQDWAGYSHSVVGASIYRCATLLRLPLGNPRRFGDFEEPRTER